MKKRVFSLLMALVMVMSLVACLSIPTLAVEDGDPRIIIDDGYGNTETILFQGNYTLPECSFPAPEGYRFRCWLVEGDRYMQPGETVYTDWRTYITAVWEPLPVVTFDNGGGTGEMESVAVDGDYSLPECGIAAPEGKQFKCWLVEDQEKHPGETITVSADITVSASWEEIPTEASTETPTEDATEAPTEAPTEATTEAPTEASTELPQENDDNDSADGIPWWVVVLIAVLAVGAGVTVTLFILKKKKG